MSQQAESQAFEAGTAADWFRYNLGRAGRTRWQARFGPPKTRRGAVGHPFIDRNPQLRVGAASAARVLFPELVDAATRVDDLLLARIERMAVRADFDLEIFPSVDLVWNVLPQLHSTVISLYSGWMPAFMAISGALAGTPLVKWGAKCSQRPRL
jgi:hypothetical protein